MADRLRCFAVAAVAATLLALPATAPAATSKPTCRGAAAVKHAKGRKGKPARRCHARAHAEPRGIDPGNDAPAAMVESWAPATRADDVLEI